jgi:hypothetical protein
MVLPGNPALLIKTVGIALIAFLSVFLTRSIRHAYLDYWSLAWTALAASLTALARRPETEARRWVEDLNAGLARVSVSGSKEPIAVTVPCGIAPFERGVGLEVAIEVADDAMYRRKQSRRKSAAAEG